MVGSKGIPSSWNDVLQLYSPLIFGILNLTPDSFSDGGKYETSEEIFERIDNLIAQGSHVIDVGPESTRPSASEIPMEIQMQRLQISFEYAERYLGSSLFSIDTRDARVARRAIEHGFSIINDVSAGRHDPNMYSVMADTEALCILMHSRGTPETMKDLTQYGDVVRDVIDELGRSIDAACAAGVVREKIMVDPGIGFAKTPEQGLELLEKIDTLKSELFCPVMVGISRKTIVSFVESGDPSVVPFMQRDNLSASMGSSLAHRGVDALRVHNVELTHSIIDSDS